MKYFITILLLISSINHLHACSCKRSGILKGQNKSDFVFTGKVVDIKKITTKEKITDSDTMIDYIRYEFIFEIKHVHKGKKNFDFKERITIITTGGGADCGNYFKMDEKYLVYAYKENYKVGMYLQDQKAKKEFMSTHLCTRTRRVGVLTFLEQFILELT